MYVPDPDIAWASATVLYAKGGSRFEVSVDPTEGGGMAPRKLGSVTVDTNDPGFAGMDSLPLQVRNEGFYDRDGGGARTGEGSHLEGESSSDPSVTRL